MNAAAPLHPIQSGPYQSAKPGAAPLDGHGALPETVQIGMHWFPERPGGLDRIYQLLIESLPEAGYAVRGMVAGGVRAAADTDGRVQAFAAADGRLPGRLLASRRLLKTLLKEHPPAVVASHFALYTAPGLDLVRRHPFVMHFHGPWAAEGMAEGGSAGMGQRLKMFLEGSVYRSAQRCIVLSNAFGDVLQQRYGVDPQAIRIVPGCVDANRFDVKESREDARRRLELPLDRPIFMTVRRLVRRMGLENLLMAMATIRAEVPDALLLIVGRGPLTDELQRRVQEGGLQDHVRLLGAVSDELLPVAYRAADLSIVPTISLEGFGLTTIESLAAGTPVLVTPVGGLPEAVRGLSADLVLPGFQPADLSRGVIDALTGRLILPDAAACMAYVRAGFDVPVMAARTAAVYDEVAK